MEGSMQVYLPGIDREYAGILNWNSHNIEVIST